MIACLCVATRRAQYDRGRSGSWGGYPSYAASQQSKGYNDRASGNTRGYQWRNDPFDEWARYQRARANYQSLRFGA